MECPSYYMEDSFKRLSNLLDDHLAREAYCQVHRVRSVDPTHQELNKLAFCFFGKRRLSVGRAWVRVNMDLNM